MSGGGLDDRSGQDIPPEYYDDISEVPCLACGRTAFRPHREIRRYGFSFSFTECPCGLIRQEPMPNQDFFEWFFNSDIFFSARKEESEEIWGFYDYFEDEPSRLATSRLRYRRLDRHLDLDGRRKIMKIGPSTGTFLNVAQEDGHEALGCDVSSRFVEYARETYGVRIDHGRFERLEYPDDSFDMVLFLNVIENVPNQEEFWDAVSRTVRPGGTVVLNFVEMGRNLVARLQGDRYFMYRPPICYMFTEPSMRNVLERFGFEPLTTWRDIRYMHLEKLTTLLGWRWLHRVSRFLRVDRLTFPAWGYPSKIVIAKRRPV